MRLATSQFAWGTAQLPFNLRGLYRQSVRREYPSLECSHRRSRQSCSHTLHIQYLLLFIHFLQYGTLACVEGLTKASIPFITPQEVHKTRAWGREGGISLIEVKNGEVDGDWSDSNRRMDLPIRMQGMGTSPSLSWKGVQVQQRKRND